MCHYVKNERNIGLNSSNTALLKSTLHTSQSFLECASTNGVFTQHGIIVWCNNHSRVSNSVHTNTGSSRMTVNRKSSGIRSKVFLRVLSGDTRLDGNSTSSNILLDQSCLLQGSSGSNTKLSLDNINSSYFFSNGMFYLDTWVDLDEVWLHVASVNKELNSSGILVFSCCSKVQGIFVEISSQLIRERPGRGHLNNLLVPTLNTTITLVQMYDISCSISNDLYLNVTRTVYKLLNENTSVTEGSQGLRGSRVEHISDIFFVSDYSHTLSSSTHGSLENNGKAVFVSKGLDLFGAIESSSTSWNNWYTSLDGGSTGTGLVTKSIQVINGGSNKLDTTL
mmetsp:Transcript_21778/g.32094  ORF Transcript_21778/g.32094 Transcript_21778/m.32094 type:complete len:337 (+) Transcript_21778:2420-3430(+)